MRINFLNILIGLLTLNAFAQEDSLVPLNANPALHNTKQASATHQHTAKVQALSLPFFDDFAKPVLYPDQTKWIDSSVYVNTGYAKAPFTIGVATFDGLNKFGYPYNPSAGISTSNYSDYLTSQPIDLSFLSLTDTSLYLSFFYQSRGFGDWPETGDSLIVQVKDPSGLSWSNLWAKAGFDPGPSDSSWRFVMLRIDDPAYFTANFQFRFRNRATQSGAVDHWHIDYVYLNAGRTSSDTIFKDIAFGYQAPSLLREYSSMPYWQLSTSNDFASSYPVFIRNNNYIDSAEIFSVPFDIYDPSNIKYVINPLGATNNIPNFLEGGWDSYPQHMNQNFSVPTPTLTDTGTYKARLKIILDNWNLDQGYNDTLYGYTKLHNYYAYDDGTAESGYFLNATGAMMCIQFTTSVPDTVTAMDIYFNPIKNIGTIGNSSYELRIWDNNNGVPGNVIYSQGLLYPDYIEDQMINSFIRDTLTSPMPLSPGTYYIGIKQTSAQELNVGFDRNYNHRNKMFYNANGSWQNSSYDGSYMIRPVMYKIDPGTGITENIRKTEISVYPNPSKGFVTINCEGVSKTEQLTAEVFDMTGRLLLSQIVVDGQTLDLPLSNGIYLMRISGRSGGTYTTRLFVTH